MSAGIHVAEASTPLLSARFVLIKEGLRSGPIYNAVSFVFIVVFFLSRNVSVTVLLYYMWLGVDSWPSRPIAWFQFSVTVSFWTLNTIWFSNAIGMMLRVLRKSKKKV